MGLCRFMPLFGFKICHVVEYHAADVVRVNHGACSHVLASEFYIAIGAGMVELALMRISL
jgi:hypothetical protein